MRLSKSWAIIIALTYTLLFSVLLCWASLSTSLLALPQTLTAEPWFITTCVDAWMGLLIITLWSWCFELNWPNRLLWFVLIMGLGNVGVGLYLIKRVTSMPHYFSLQDFFIGKARHERPQFEEK